MCHLVRLVCIAVVPTKDLREKMMLEKFQIDISDVQIDSARHADLVYIYYFEVLQTSWIT